MMKKKRKENIRLAEPLINNNNTKQDGMWKTHCRTLAGLNKKKHRIEDGRGVDEDEY